MNKIRLNTLIFILGLISLASFLVSGWTIVTTPQTSAAYRGECTEDCPDGTKVSCSGTTLSTIDDPRDPGCICDGREYRCSMKNKDNGENNTNTNSPDKKKEKKEKKKKP